MKSLKEPRPDIPKLPIVKIGGVTDEGVLFGEWGFDGTAHPKSVGQYFSDDWNLFGGYTVDELRDISKEKPTIKGW